MTGAITRLAALCRRWGGELVVVPTLRGQRLASRHPQKTCGIDWDARRVIARADANPGTVVHEMAHVFCVPRRPNDMDDELEWLGWEVAVARLVGCYSAWTRQMNSYSLGYVCPRDDGWERTWSDARKDGVIREVIDDRLKEARRLRYVDRGLRPLCVRSEAT